MSTTANAAAAPLRILVLSDGRPGHFNLSKGIVAALATRRPVTETWLDVRRGRWPGWLAAAITNAALPPARVFDWVYGQPLRAVPAVDLVVSAGAETLAANIAIARGQNVPNVFYGSLRQFRPRDFTLVLTSYDPPAGATNVVRALKPSARTRPDSSRQPSPARHLGLLVGGPSPGISYSISDWTQLLAAIKAATANCGRTWIVSNSRRTPDEASTRLADLAATHPSPIETFIDVRRPASSGLDTLFDQAAVVVATADSSSMISEAIWAGLPVLAVTPGDCKFNARELGYRRWLTGQGWLAEAPIAGLTAEAILRLSGRLTPIETDPAIALADLLYSRLPNL